MLKYKIAIVNSSSFGKIFPEHLNKLKKIGEVRSFTFKQNVKGDFLAKELQGYNIIVSSVTPYFGKEFFDNKDELLLISRHGIGYNNIDLESAKNHNTIVSIVSPLVERDAVAENHITNLLNVMRKTTKAYEAVINGKWEYRANFVGNTLYNKKVGIIGVGNTGSCIGETLRNGFRCNVMGYDPYKSKVYMEQFGIKKVELNDLLKESDIICLCANLTEESYHIIDEKEIEKMKDNVYISNAARGDLVNENAIIKALESGKLKAYATDILEFEPIKENHEFLTLSNVLITPHTSAYTMECLYYMGEKCVEDCEKIIKGELPIRSVQSISKYVKSK
ncbi:D-isomer specific 2-hydroxyacid dehydrogenase family protein [Oceanivirga salmonicida]|uniref:D-isomer specific 2-hydroxyacid dehydrogenase family protein n=1 Tax=Oceanivirga salmonicida TaxID=1769291 RepID=UPI0012E16883|nr:D-isomer specific 2-hydroxyacid dehydrogenase family protein [Oceanivirga salmonicida]